MSGKAVVGGLALALLAAFVHPGLGALVLGALVVPLAAGWGRSPATRAEDAAGRLASLELRYVGLTRRSLAFRLAGFALFGVSLAKLFLYDLAYLSSLARALSFLAVGGLLLLGGFFYQRLSAGLEERDRSAGGGAAA